LPTRARRRFENRCERLCNSCSLSRVSRPTFENQSYRASGLNLAIAAIVYWNTVYMERAVAHLKSTGVAAPDHLLAHTSPLGWSHISLTVRSVIRP
jgi:hypothetical protein